jgi:hypothetical protein
MDKYLIIGDYSIKWTSEGTDGKEHTIVLTKHSMNPDPAATTNLAVATDIKTFTHTDET